MNMLYDITSMGWFVFILSAVMLYVLYRQLFGYGIWGTVWRLAATLICAGLFAAILLFVDFSIHMFPAGMQGEAMGFVVLTVPCVIAYFLILWISYWVNKPRPPKTKPQSVPVEPTTVKAEPESAATASAEQKTQPEQKPKPESKPEPEQKQKKSPAANT